MRRGKTEQPPGFGKLPGERRPEPKGHVRRAKPVDAPGVRQLPEPSAHLERPEMKQAGLSEPPREPACQSVVIEFAMFCPTLPERLSKGGDEVVLECLDLFDEDFTEEQVRWILGCFRVYGTSL